MSDYNTDTANEERLCHYCHGPMEDENFRVVKGDEIVDAHKSCHKKSMHGGLNIRIIMR